METENIAAEEAVIEADITPKASEMPETEPPLPETGAKEAPEAEKAPEKAPAEAPEAADTPLPDAKCASAERVEELRRIEKLNEEYSNFKELFPDIKISELPDEVEKSVNTGVPLDAACALHKVRREAAEKKAAEVNESNRKLSAGAVRKSTSNYLTIEEISAMSQLEVRKNFDLVLESLQNLKNN